jgi:hypothetical protein
MQPNQATLAILGLLGLLSNAVSLSDWRSVACVQCSSKVPSPKFSLLFLSLSVSSILKLISFYFLRLFYSSLISTPSTPAPLD